MAYSISDIVRDGRDVPVGDALVYVYAPSGGLALLYNSLGIPIENPLATNSNGLYEGFSTESGFHTVKINYGGRERYAKEIMLGINPVAEVDQINPQNLFQNTDLLQGNQGNVLVPNDALDAVGLTNWVAQQTGLNPFVSVQRGLNEDGLYTIRMINGIPSSTPNTISTGPYPFTVAPGLNFAPGIDVRVADADDPLNKWMEGTVTAYNAGTGALTLDITSRGPVGGTSNNWYIGRNGVTTKSTPVYNIVSADVATGSTVIPLASTASIERGANVEEAVGNGIAKGTYVVSKTANSITISRPIIAPISAGYQLTTYGDQGWYLYQNIGPENANSFKNGTPDAVTSYLTFKVRSRHIQGTASVMALGYSSLFTLGRSYAAPFEVSEQEAVVTVPIYGDTQSAPGTWLSGYDRTTYPYLGVGFAWVSRGTNTSKNIVPYEWSNAFAVAGSQGQTLDLASVVGAWVEVSEIRFGYGPSRTFFYPLAIEDPTPVKHVRAPLAPRVLYEATRNPAGLRKIQTYEDFAGSLIDQKLADDESSGTILRVLETSGSQDIRGVYKIGGSQVVAGRQPIVAQPSGGSTIDTQARTAINALIARLQTHGLID